MTYVVYTIRTINDNICYYGRSQEFEKRKRAHLNMLRTNSHSNSNLQNNYNQYGENNFVFQVIHTFNNLHEAIECEEKYIKDKNIIKHNVSDSAIGGGDNFSLNPKKEDIRKMRKEQMSGKRNHQYGKTKSDKMIQSVKNSNSKSILVNGITYRSLTDCSLKTGVKVTTLNYRLNSENFKNYNYV